MAKKKNIGISEKMHFWQDMREETIQAILAIIAFLFSILFILAAFEMAGIVGRIVLVFFSRLFGIGYYLIPTIFAMLGISFIYGYKKKLDPAKMFGSLLFLIAGLGLIHVFSTGSGGIVGRIIAIPLLSLMDFWATIVLLAAVLIISIIMTFNLYLSLENISLFRARTSSNDNEDEEEKVQNVLPKTSSKPEEDKEEKIKIAASKSEEKPKIRKAVSDFSDDGESSFATAASIPHLLPFTPPPLSLLEKDKGKPETGDIKANANIIKRTLMNFGITVEMDEISIGPSVTRYALKPAEGVKLSRIVSLNNDLALSLAAHPIRIEAPIPGKSLVGIEVPNTAKTTVGLATLLGSSEYQESEKPLLVSLGKDISGKAHFANLAKAPHMLIAGATGSGKSVTIHAIISSLLYRNSPENLRFLMIDPKRVELTLYNKTPHLLLPVITDPKKAIIALRWAANEMTRRYNILEQHSARDIDSYHKNVLIPALDKVKSLKEVPPDAVLPESMPYIVIVIDELADIMQTYPRELEASIVKLAQMSRAIGIHLIISTQRPSVNVITGLIKANIPTRVALQVASQIDSRTILDQMGAEKLLGAGDMLYLGGEMSKPVRLQSAYISESEVKTVVKFLADQYRDEIISQINITPTEPGSTAAFDAMLENGSLEEEDELYEEAKEEVIKVGKASTSYLQRRLGVGYSRAAKIIDLLEKNGVVGPANGSKPREILGAESETQEIQEDIPPPTEERI